MEAKKRSAVDVLMGSARAGKPVDKKTYQANVLKEEAKKQKRENVFDVMMGAAHDPGAFLLHTDKDGPEQTIELIPTLTVTASEYVMECPMWRDRCIQYFQDDALDEHFQDGDLDNCPDGYDSGDEVEEFLAT
jgi:hypothetical protein